MVRTVRSADFVVGDVANPVDPVLDRPVAADPGAELRQSGLLDEQVGDGIDGLQQPPATTAHTAAVTTTVSRCHTPRRVRGSGKPARAAGSPAIDTQVVIPVPAIPSPGASQAGHPSRLCRAPASETERASRSSFVPANLVSGPARSEGSRRPWGATSTVRSGQTLVDVDPVDADAKFRERLYLRSEVMFVNGQSGVADLQAIMTATVPFEPR
jgi:hypothetical protein